MTGPESDPITLEIIQNSLQAISDEMFAAFRKTAMSAIIYEVLDMGTCITDSDGNLASSGAGIPAFVGVLDKAVKRIIEVNAGPTRFARGHLCHQRPLLRRRHPSERRRAGDARLCRGRRVAWTANIAHWNDVGGMVPGSISNEPGDLPGGLAPPRNQARFRRHADRVRHGDHEMQQPPPRLPRG